MPETRRALASGEVTPSSARVLVAAREASPEAFARAEGSLVEAAKSQTVEGMTRVAEGWRQKVDADRALEHWRRLRESRRLSLSRRLSGMVHIRGDLDPETGECVITAIKAITDAEARTAAPSDPRSGEQRRADALGDVCRGFLDRPDRPVVGGERPHVTITVDVSALSADGGSSPAEFEHLGPIHPDVARRLTCDAAVSRVITAGRSQPLEVGRRTHIVSPAIRRAVVIRDRTCRFPTCDRPAGWCQCHHVVHWARGGVTGVSNLVLLCSRHHHLVHEDRWMVEMAEGRPRFRRPDGTPIPERAERAERAPPDG